MGDFRYAQFCPLARAAEVLGHRWTLLVLRELCLGPQRFSDLARRLSGVSTSVLSERLAAMEEQGIVCRRQLPPTPAVHYALTPDGEALRPAMIALTRWGVRRLTFPLPGDHIEPDWLRMAVEAFARSGPTPPLAFALRAGGAGEEVTVRVRGGPEGTQLLPRRRAS